MGELSLVTPTFLFSAVSLILLAYTNRFLSYAQVVRTLTQQYSENPSELMLGQILNLRRRIFLTRSMQILGISSLFLCVVTMFFIYVGFEGVAAIIFGVSLILLIASLGVSVWEIVISSKSIDIFLEAKGIKSK